MRVYDRVKETTTTTGTGNLTTLGAPPGFRTLNAAAGVGIPVYYIIQHQSANEYEEGIGHLSASTTFVRDYVLRSSNSNAGVSLSAGTKDVFISPLQEEFYALDLMLFGDGSDGDVTVSGALSLTRDMYYMNLTCTTGCAIVTNGFRIFVREVLDISAAPATSIQFNGATGGDGSGSTAGSNGASVANGTVGGSLAGRSGGAGGTAAGSAGTAGVASSPNNGGAGGAGGNGGLGSGGAGGAGAAGGAVSNASAIKRFITDLLRGAELMLGGNGGGGGGGGGGDGTAGGGGGGGGSGGGVIFIAARAINRSASTAANCIRAVGGPGGNGANAAGTNRGGGGGAGGGGGGWIYIAFMHLLGAATVLNAVKAYGNIGGNGGSKTGTGVAGSGGASGAGGRITMVNIGANTVTETVGPASNAASGSTGGAITTTTVDF